MSPGDGFDESDQFWSRGFWGKASTWRRWQEQHTGDYRDTCPLREEEKRQKMQDNKDLMIAGSCQCTWTCGDRNDGTVCYRKCCNHEFGGP